MADAPLLDFLYRDTARISSYCAQLFEGRLSSLERSASAKDQTDSSVKVGVSLIGGERKNTTDHQSSIKHTIDPHDTAATSLLERLRPRLRTEVASAPNASPVSVKGTLFLFDVTGQTIVRTILNGLPAELLANAPAGMTALHATRSQ